MESEKISAWKYTVFGLKTKSKLYCWASSIISGHVALSAKTLDQTRKDTKIKCWPVHQCADSPVLDPNKHLRRTFNWFYQCLFFSFCSWQFMLIWLWKRLLNLATPLLKEKRCPKKEYHFFLLEKIF